MDVTMSELTDAQREMLEAKFTGIVPDERIAEILDDVLTEGASTLPIDSALEVQLRMVDGDAFEESHNHFEGDTLTYHLTPEDAREFEAALHDKLLLPLVAESMEADE